MTATDKTILTAVIVDDESLARTFLKEMLRAHPEIDVIAECSNGFQAVQTVVDKKPDLLFLDIEMPKLNGFEVLEALEPEAPRVIFVTAYDEYAVKAFEVHAVDYLLKPFSKDRLAAAVARLEESPAPALPTARQIAAESGEAFAAPKRFVIRDGGTVTVVNTSEISYIAAEGDYIAVHTDKGVFLKLETIYAAEKALSENAFVRIHRSTVINLDRLDRIDTSDKDAKEAVLKDGTRLAVSRTGYKTLMDTVAKNG